MKPDHFMNLGSGVLLLVTVPVVHAQSGGSYRLNWSTFDGGGGHCSGGKLTLSGTAGQPDASYSAGNTFVHLGGFLPAFQKSEGPRLQMTITASTVSITWPNVCAGFVIEGAPTVTGPWTALGGGTLLGNSYQLSLTPPIPYQFFQLRKDCPH